MDALCPQCARPMIYRAQGLFHCDDCLSDYQQLTYCPECHQPLQKLQGCGATDYLCQNGHGLISKKRVIVEYQKR
jgi:predicted amidophosphoribosyltransferase